MTKSNCPLMDTQQLPTSASGRFLRVVLLVGAFAIGFTLWIRSGLRPEPIGGLAPGNPAPPIQAQGWINGEPPSSKHLAGKVVVLDAWATYCLPCRRAAPEMIRTYEKYKGRGVVFIGLTAEGEELLPQIQEFLADTKIPWVNGYGAVDTLIALDATAIPNYWVVGPNGNIVWNADSGSLDEGIQHALAMHAER